MSEKSNNNYCKLKHDICVGMGFCGSVTANGKPSHLDDYIPKSGPVSSDEFADWVLLAEGMKPENDYTYKPQFKKLFVHHMGADVVDASLFK